MRPWLWERAAQVPDAEALAAPSGRLSFRALAERAEALAGRLAAAGVRPHDRVALCLAPDLDFVAALHATWRLGAAVLSLNLRLTRREIAAQLGRAQPRLVLEGPRALDELPHAAAPPPEHPVDFAACALVLFTSGTTGVPKAVPLSFGNLHASALASAARLGSLPADRWLACLPLHHVGGLSILTRAVLDGASVTLHAGFDAARVSRSLDAGGITLVSLVPTMLKRLLDARADRAAPPGLRALLLGGAAAPPALLARARAAGFPVLPTYGLTEAASQVATAPPGACGPGVGPPLPGTEIRIVGDTDEGCGTGESGEIQVRGPSVFAGYLDDPAASAAALRDGWLRTGDCGWLDERGVLHVRDRRSDLVVTGGENVSPAEVEQALLAHPSVQEAAVGGRPDADLGQRVVAWVVLRRDVPADADALRAHCRERVAGYKVPREVEFVRELPRDAMGKLARARLGAASASGSKG